MYRGHLRSRAYSKEALAKPLIESSVLYMARATPTPYCDVRSLCRLYQPALSNCLTDLYRTRLTSSQLDALTLAALSIWLSRAALAATRLTAVATRPQRMFVGYKARGGLQGVQRLQ